MMGYRTATLADAIIKFIESTLALEKLRADASASKDHVEVREALLNRHANDLHEALEGVERGLFEALKK